MEVDGIINNLKKQYALWREQGIAEKMSETDTQVLLIEPILGCAGWDSADPQVMRRANRDNRNRPRFDIEVYENDSGYEVLRVAVECKSLTSAEFNVGKLLDGEPCGGLRIEDGRWRNDPGDGVGQLRAYCAN